MMNSIDFNASISNPRATETPIYSDTYLVNQLPEIERYLMQELGNETRPTLDSLVEHFNNNFSSATELFTQQTDRAARTAAFIFLVNLLTDEEFASFRENNQLRSVDDLELIVASLILKRDFDRSFDFLNIISNGEELIAIPNSESQYYENNIQFLMVNELVNTAQNDVMEKYLENPEIVVGGELTNLGRMLALITVLSHTGVSRMGQNEIVWLTTGDLYFSTVEFINQLEVTQSQRILIQQILDSEYNEGYIDYGTIYPGDAFYDYLNALNQGFRDDVHNNILYFKQNYDGSIDIYINGNVTYTKNEILNGEFPYRSRAQMILKVQNLFPINDDLRFRIERYEGLRQARMLENDILTSALGIIDTPSVRFNYEAKNYIPTISQSSTEHLATLIQTSIQNTDSNTLDTSRLTDENYLFVWLNDLVEGRLAIVNPTLEQRIQFPNSISIIKSGNQYFFRVRSLSNRTGINEMNTYEITDSGEFIDTLIPLSEDNLEYMIITNS